MFDPDKDTPVQDKHPDWLQWFQDNDLDIHRMAAVPAPEYNAETKVLEFRYYLSGWNGMRVFNDDNSYHSQQITKRVKTPPPWETVD